jgi:hypothetical protein
MRRALSCVMPALVAGIQVFLAAPETWMAGHKPGHDDVERTCFHSRWEGDRLCCLVAPAVARYFQPMSLRALEREGEAR